MNRYKPNKSSKAKTNNANSASSSILPDDQEIASRYVAWKQLLDKYNRPGKYDEEGISVDDVLEMYVNFDDDSKYDENSENENSEEEALECSDENEDVGSSYSASEYETMKKQFTSAVKERNVQWKANGLERILSSDFNMSADSVLQWIQSSEAGIGKLLTNAKETRFTEYNDDTQMNVICREDISILNESDRQQFTAANTSNIEYMDKNRGRMILHQVEKRTVSSYFVIDPTRSNAARPNLDMKALLQSLPDSTPFKKPRPLASYDPANMCPSVTMVPEFCLNSVLKKQAKPASQRKVCFKPVRKHIARRKRIESSDSSESDDSDRSQKKCANSSPKGILPRRCIGRDQNNPSVSVQKTCGKHSLSFNGTPAVLLKDCPDIVKQKIEPSAEQKNVRNEYPMPESYRQVYSINGRCRYKTSGTVIYRPKPIGSTLAENTDKICIRTEDLDLSGIESMEKRQKFANFCRLAHPNSTLVYYMSESEDDEADEPEDDANDVSWDDDDPLLTYNPPCVLTFFDNQLQRS